MDDEKFAIRKYNPQNAFIVYDTLGRKAKPLR
jgi:hypothetical protein